MANLKLLKQRIKSVKSTQKITKAMKMVAASKLRRAQDRVEKAKPYALRMQRVLASLAANLETGSEQPKLLVGTGRHDKHLLICVTSDRGLCGGLNSSVARAVRQKVNTIKESNGLVKILCIGSKGYDQLKHQYERIIIDKITDLSKRHVTYEDAETIGLKILGLFDAGEFNVCSVIFSSFQTVLVQQVTEKQIIPLTLDTHHSQLEADTASYIYEPDEHSILEDLLPRNIHVQILHALLESAASEQGARMSAMDNATRNAGEMIKDLTLEYNRTRQAVITKELVEIISGAEAL